MKLQKYPECNYLCWNLNRRFQLPIFLSEKYNGNFLATSYRHEFLCNDSGTAFPNSIISNSHQFHSEQCGTMLPFDIYFSEASPYSMALFCLTAGQTHHDSADKIWSNRYC